MASLASNDFTLPPKRGGRAITAVSMPGSAMSMVNIAWPRDLARESVRRTSLPISLKSFGSFSSTSLGGSNLAALTARSPNAADLPLALCERRPLSTLISAAATPQSCAAASTRSARAVAPAWRICLNELAIALLPPVPWAGPH